MKVDSWFSSSTCRKLAKDIWIYILNIINLLYIYMYIYIYIHIYISNIYICIYNKYIYVYILYIYTHITFICIAVLDETKVSDQFFFL